MIITKQKLTHDEVRNTIKVTASKCISKYGDILFDYMNSIFLAKLGNGSFFLSLYQSSEVITSVIFNFLGGIVSDFKNRKDTIFYCDIFSGISCILLGLLMPKGGFLYAILLINVILAITSSLRNPAYKAVFKEIVYEKNIGKVNSILETGSEIIKISGPAISVPIANFFGNRVGLILDGLSFILSGVLIKNLSILTEREVNIKRGTTFQQIKEGFKYLGNNKAVLFIVIFSSLINFVLAGYNLILPFSTYAFSGSGHKSTYAIFLTADSIGGLVGAAVSGLGPKKTTISRLLVLMIFCGCSLIPLNFLFEISNSILLSSTAILLFEFFLAIFNIRFMTFVQEKTDSNYAGRVFSIIFSVAILFVPVGTFFFQAILSIKNANNYILIGTLLTVISIVALLINFFTNRWSR